MPNHLSEQEIDLFKKLRVLRKWTSGCVHLNAIYRRYPAARAYRELALLLRRPPGREAFPGDILYPLTNAKFLAAAYRIGGHLQKGKNA